MIGRNKSVGRDGIPGAILKMGGEAMIPYLARLLDVILLFVHVFLSLSTYTYCCLCSLIVRPCILIVVYVYLLLSMYSYCSSMYSYRCLCILIVAHVFLDAATLTEVFPCFFLGCKANARV